MIQLDEIGTLYDAPVLDANGMFTVQPLELDGWHVNSTYPIPGWGAYQVTPSTPRRVFAGVDTVFYAFATRRAFQLLLVTADLRIPAPLPTVPAAITMRQARLALLSIGKLARIDAIIDSLPEPQSSGARIEWDFSSDVQRTSALVAQLALALGLDDAALDALFVQAGAL